MYKLMIVDDEALARYAFQTLISKNFNDIEIICEAENGRQAIEFNRIYRPDIIVMDIKMPGINGIDASREIINEFPETNILILTAYDNFDYIQQALDIGVKGYLLKPLKKDEVVGKITKVISGLTESESKVDFKQHVDSKIKLVRPFIEKELVSAFITGSIDINEVRSYINFLQEKIEAGYFMLLSCGYSYAESINDSVRNKIHRDKVYDVIIKHLPLMKKCMLGSFVGNVIIVFFPLESMKTSASVKDESLVIGNEIKRRVKVIAGIDIGVGIGRAHTDIEKLRNSYDEANFAVRQAVICNSVVHYNEIENKTIENDGKYPAKLENEFLDSLRIGNIDKARDLNIEIISAIFNYTYDPLTIKEYLSEYITILKRTAVQMGVDEVILHNTGTLMELNSLFELDELMIWCKNALNTLIDQVEAVKQNRNSDVVGKIHDYVNRQFSKDITLEMAAEEVALSPQYLSKLFKEEFGMNFIDYITSKRISYAKELLRNGSMSVKEISRKSGYSDENYFCRLFKKVTGLTPKQYRLGS